MLLIVGLERKRDERPIVESFAFRARTATDPFPSLRGKFGREGCDSNLTELHPYPLRRRHRDDVIKLLDFEYSPEFRVAALDFFRRHPTRGNARSNGLAENQ